MQADISGLDLVYNNFKQFRFHGEMHLEILLQFGRYPMRNEILGR